MMPLVTLFLIAANLLPLAGVFFWGWDVFVLLLLYWLETLVIAFWAIVAMLLPLEGVPPGEAPVVLGRSVGTFAGRLVLALFMTAHAGMFMAVHFVFLWLFFAGSWATSVAGPATFWSELIVGRELWAPLLFLFAVRGWQVLRGRLFGFLGLAAAESGSGLRGGLYGRIIVMQLTIIFGGWIALSLGGNVGALVLLVVLKTAVEFLLDPESRRGAGGARANADG